MRIMQMMKKLFIINLFILFLITGFARFAFAGNIPVLSVSGSPNTAHQTPSECIIDNNTDTFWGTEDCFPESAWVDLSFSEDIWTSGIGIYGTFNGILSIFYWQDETWCPFIAAENLKSSLYDSEWTLIDISYDRIATGHLRLVFTNPGGLSSLGGLKEVKITGSPDSTVLTGIDPVTIRMYKNMYRCPGGHGQEKTNNGYLLFDHNTYTDWQDNRNAHSRGEEAPVNPDEERMTGSENSEDLLFHDGKDDVANNYFPWDKYPWNNDAMAFAELEYMCSLSEIKLFISRQAGDKEDQRCFPGEKDTFITIMYKWHNMWKPVPGLLDVSLEQLEAKSEGWHNFPINPAIKTDNVCIRIRGRDKTGLKEIELWGNREKALSPGYIYVDSSDHILDENQPVNYMFQLKEAKEIKSMLLHITGKSMSASPLMLEVNGKESGELFFHSVNNEYAVYQAFIDPGLLWKDVNFLRIYGSYIEITDCRIEIPDNPFYVSIFHHAENGLVDRWENSPVHAYDETIDLKGTWDIDSLYLRFLGERSSFVLSLEKDGEWQEWTGEQVVVEDDFGGEILCRDIGTVKRINVRCTGPNDTPAEIWFCGSYVNDGPPRITILSPHDGDIIGINEFRYARLSGTVDNPETDLYVNGRPVHTTGCTFDIPLSHCGIQSWGKQTIEVKAVDRTGRTVTGSITVFIDFPVSFTVNLPDRIVYTALDQIPVFGKVMHRKTKIKINGLDIPVSQREYRTIALLQEGINIITIQADISWGKYTFTGIKQRIVISTSRPPVLTVHYPADGQIVNTPVVKISGEVISLLPAKVTVNGKPAVVTGSTFISQPVSLNEGENTIAVHSETEGGLYADKTISVWLDTGAPELTVETPEENVCFNTPSVKVSGTVRDNSPVSVLVNGYPASIDNDFFTITILLDDGVQTIRIKAVDAAGNETRAERHVTIDTQPPLEFIPVTDPPGWTNNTMPTITFKTEDTGTGMDHYELYLDNRLLSDNAVSPYTFTRPMSDGIHTVAVDAFDRAGNSIKGEVQCFIDTMPPAVPKGLQTISGIDYITLYWTDSPEEATGYRIERELPFPGGEDRTIQRTLTEHTLGTWYDTDIVSKQFYTYRIRAIDRAFNISAASEPVTVQADYVKEKIDKNGGTIYFDALTITLPEESYADAYSVVIEAITTTLPDNPYATKTGQAYDIRLTDSDGHEIEALKKPALLTINYGKLTLPEGFEPGNLGIYCYQEEGGWWEKCGYVINDYLKQTLTVKRLHFSPYQPMASKYTSPSLDSYYEMGVSPFQSYFNDNIERTSEGLLTINAVDVSLPGRGGFDLIIKRVYDSLSAQQDKILEKNPGEKKAPVDTFGYGWSLAIPWMEQTDKGKFIRLPDGQTVKLELSGSRFEYHEGLHFTVFLDNGQYNLLLKDGTRYYFDDAGRAVRQVDPGTTNEITFHYDGREIEYITDSIGRRVYFYYRTAGSKRVIDRITVNNRTTRYSYTSGGMLCEVTDPADRKTIYNYTSLEFNAGDFALWGNDYFVEYRNKKTGERVRDNNYIYVKKDGVDSYRLDLIDEIIYPTGGTSTYKYEIKDQYETETWDEWNRYTKGVPAYPDWEAYVEERYYGTVRYYGQKLVVKEHSRAGKVTAYTCTMNNKSGTLRENTFIPANMYLRSSKAQCGDRSTEEIYTQLIFDGYYQLTDEPADPSFYRVTLPVSIATRLGSSLYEKVTYEYHLPIRAVHRESHYRGSESNFAWYLTCQYDNWGNLTYLYDTSRDLEQTWSYHGHSRIKDLVQRQTVKNQNPDTGTIVMTTEYSYDDFLGKPSTITQSDGTHTYITILGYDSYGNLSTRQDPNKKITRYYYDATKHAFPDQIVVSNILDADNYMLPDIVTRYSYDTDTGMLEWEQDAEGHRTSCEYDILNRLTKLILPDDDGSGSNNPYREYIFDDRHNTCTVFNENRQKSIFRFDGYGRITQIDQYTPDLGYSRVSTLYDYDDMGRIKKVTDPRGYVTHYLYDSLDRLTRITYPSGNAMTPIVQFSYNDLANTTLITDENGGKTEERKDWADRVVEARQYCTYENTETIYTRFFFYDSLGNMIKEYDANSNQTDYRYDGFNRTTRIIQPDTPLMLPGYPDPHMARPTINYEYDPAGNMSLEIDPKGNRTEYENDRLSRLSKEIRHITDPFTGQTETAVTKHYYDLVGNRIKTIDPEGGIWKHTYSARGFLLTETDPEGNTNSYAYDAMGNRTSETDPNGFITYYTYDDLNRLVKTILPDNTPGDLSDNPYTEITCDEAGNKLTERDANGLVTHYTYTERNRIDTVIQNGIHKEHYVYDKNGNVVETDNAMGNKTRQFYDSLDRLRMIRFPEGNEEQYTYDPAGNRTLVKDGRGHETRYFYNGLGLLSGVLDPLGNHTEYRYDLNSNQVQLVMPNSLVHTSRFDELNRLVETVDSLGYTTKIAYDLNGNIREKFDPRGTRWTYEYKDNNLLRWGEATGADGSTYRVDYTYDNSGNLVEVADTSGSITYNTTGGIYQPDPLNRIKRAERRFDGAVYTTSYRYEKPYLVGGITYPEAVGELEYTYNTFNQVSGVTGFTQPGGITYRDDNSLERICLVNGTTASYEYDLNTRLNNINIVNNTDDILALNYTYDNANNISQINDKTYEYDKINQLTRYEKPGKFLETKKAPVKHGYRPEDCQGISPLDFDAEPGVIIHLDYNSTSIGLDMGKRTIRVKKILLIPDGEHQIHRITDASIELYHSNYNSQYKFIPRSKWEYGKDENGIITITLDEVITSRYLKLNVLFDERDKNFTPENRAEFMNSLAGMLEVYFEATSWTEEYEYDKCGNRILQRVTLIQADVYESEYYENSNRLKTDGTYAYTYDEAGNLTAKGNTFEIDGEDVMFTTKSGDGVEYREYSYDLLNRLTCVKKNGSIAAEYGYDPQGYRVVKKAGGEVIHYVFEGTEPVFEKNVTTDDVKSYVYVLGKHLARVDGVIGDNEASVWFIHTDHLGSIRVVTDKEGVVVWSTDYKPFGELFGQEGEGFEEWHGFTGKELDADVGLVYYGARWYDVGTGRFITEDPVKDGLNWYVYCSNNPLMFIDPNGLEKIIISGGIAGYEKNRYNFIETAIRQINVSKNQNPDEKITWAISTHGYTEKEIKNFQKTAEKNGVNIVLFDDKDTLITYMNEGEEKNRKDDKITLVANFSHGGTGEKGGLWLAYGQDEEIRDATDITKEDIEKFNKEAFDNPVSLFYSCNTGTGGDESFAQEWVNQVGGVAQAAVGLTSYYDVNKDRDFWDKVGKQFGGSYYETGSLYPPTPDYENNAYWDYFTSIYEEEDYFDYYDYTSCDE